jgi:hypothetical protein
MNISHKIWGRLGREGIRNQSSFISTQRRHSLEAGGNGGKRFLKSKDGGLVFNRRSSLPGSSLPGFNKSLYHAMM